MSEYHAVMGPLGRGQADELGKWLAAYAVAVSGLTVQYELPDGRLVTDHGMADVVTRQAGMLGGGAVGGAATAVPVAGAATALGCGPLLAALCAPLLPLLAGVVAVGTAVHPVLDRHNQQTLGHPQAVATHIMFHLAGVSAQRRRWSEYLLAIWVARHNWHMTGWQHPEQVGAGAAYAATHGGYPPPWRDQPRPAARPSRRRRRPTDRTSPGLLARLDDLLR